MEGVKIIEKFTRCLAQLEGEKKKSCLNVYEGYRVLDVINKCLILCIAVMKEVLLQSAPRGQGSEENKAARREKSVKM